MGIDKSVAYLIRVISLTKTKRRKTEWITNEILKMMEERRKYKSQDKNKYNEIRREIRNKIRQAKDKYFEM